MSSTPPEDLREWWVWQLAQQPDGRWDVQVQFRDGHQLRLLLEPSRDLDHVIAAAVRAHLAGDRRYRDKRAGG